MTYSIVCPVYNEIEYINSLIEFLNEVNPLPLEIYFIDGGSTDGTLKILNKIASENERFILLKNENKTVPYALNLAIPKCKGDIIVRIDAHSVYDINYFKEILKTFEEIDADIVGGATRTIHKGGIQESVAYVFNTPFGMGNSSVHNVEYRGYTDSVTFGAWRKEIFKRTGLFDVSLKRNQDDEFHYRAKALGFKIYQNPDIKLWYYPRNNYKSLFIQYYQYGLYKPLVLKKVKSEIKIRHLVPSIFIIYLIWFPILVSISFYLAIPFIFYILFATYYSLNYKSFFFKILFSYLIIHSAYGTGFLLGLCKL